MTASLKFYKESNHPTSQGTITMENVITYQPKDSKAPKISAPLKFYADHGHGWLEVPRTQLEDMDIEEKISSFSYQNGDFVYLEEDCDLTIYLNARFPKAERDFIRQWFDSSTTTIRSGYPRQLASYT
jgi:hypothetical protein